MADDRAPAADSSADDKPAEQNPSDIVTYWNSQLGAYDDEFKDWLTRCKKIVRRYRDERQEAEDGRVQGGARFNSLWSNVQTLQPAIYINPPQPVVERRYRDKDPLARTASMTLERSCEVMIEIGKLHPAMRKAVLDYLLCGRGTLWERYEPTYGEAQDLGVGPDADKSTDGPQQAGEAPRPVTYEKVCTDYVAFNKFRHSPAATWDEVWWVAKEEMLTRKELRARFKKKNEAGQLIADLVPLRSGDKDKESDREKKRLNPRAVVQEIWNKRDRKVIFVAPDYANDTLEETDDPLSLDQFWPCPAPLYATITNDSLVPVPDYVEYQDQADELDSLTARIKALTDAVRVNGVYDASIPELKRILQEGADNRLIGVAKWSELTTKGGIEKSVDFIPFDKVVAALIQLYDAFERVQAKMDQINGLSDIVRGQSSGAAKTATEQRIKGQFASLRLDDRKKEVARFARDCIAIKAEIISEQFSPEILADMTGMIPFITDEIKAEMPAQPPAPPPPMMGHNGGPPLEAPPGMSSPVPGAGGAPGPVASPPPAGGLPPQMPAMAPMAPPMPPPPDPAQLAQERFTKACELLRDDKMRTFRIDIETDSTVEPDRQAAKEAVTEMATAVGGLLEKAMPIGQMMPKLVPALGQTLLFVLRTFGAGRDVEGIWEMAIDDMTKMAKNPPAPPPNPEQIKAETAKAQGQQDMAMAQQQMQFDQQKGQMELQALREKHQMELEAKQADIQIKREELQIERERMAMDRERAMFEAKAAQHKAGLQMQTETTKAAIQGDAMNRQAQIAEEQDNRAAEQGERGHELEMESMEAQAAAKQKAAKGAAA
jgi:hypothetical protein